MSTTIRVQILDREYALRVKSEDDARMTRELASFVDQRLRAFRREHPDRPELTGLVITALAITEELFETRKALEEMNNDTREQMMDLERMLGEALAE
jgi:cell division protein ZapA